MIAFGEILSLVSEIADVLGGILALGFTLPGQVTIPVIRPDNDSQQALHMLYRCRPGIKRDGIQDD